MIVCPNCNHQNPEGALQCEACYTPLPSMVSCPNCGASIQSDATFCGQCGYNLRPVNLGNDFPPLVPPTVAVKSPSFPEGESYGEIEPEITTPTPPSNERSEERGTVVSFENDPLAALGVGVGDPFLKKPEVTPTPTTATTPSVSELKPLVENNTASLSSATQLQTQKARLLHLQTNTNIEIPQNLSLIHIGKQNNQIPPDIDVSGFPNSEIVSRVHADIRIEGDAYFLEDMGSSNGTYINHTPLLAGDRHRLRSGDRVGLGKGDKMTFIFQLS